MVERNGLFEGGLIAILGFAQFSFIMILVFFYNGHSNGFLRLPLLALFIILMIIVYSNSFGEKDHLNQEKIIGNPPKP